MDVGGHSSDPRLRAAVGSLLFLVVGGLYRYIRNPMYVAVALTIIGQAMVLGRPSCCCMP